MLTSKKLPQRVGVKKQTILAIFLSLFISLCDFSHFAYAATLDHPILYVRYPRTGPTVDEARCTLDNQNIDLSNYREGSGCYGNLYDDFAYANRCYGDPGWTGETECPADYHVPTQPPLPDVKHLYRVGEGGDLVFYRPDGTERILVNNDERRASNLSVGSIADIAVSPDAQWVAYTQIEDARLDDVFELTGGESRMDIYKMFVGNENDARFGVAECLTCTFEYQLDRFQGYDPLLDDPIFGNPLLDDSDGSAPHLREVVHMSPLWLPDNRIVFSSTMAGEAISGIPNMSEERVDFFASQEMEPALQLFIMDDDGTNLHRISPSVLSRAQHATLLEDGRIVFSFWETSSGRRLHNGFHLTEIAADGSGFRQFAGRHQSMSNSLNFAVGMPGNSLCAIQYYNDQSAGFGSEICYPTDPTGPDFTNDPNDAFDLVQEGDTWMSVYGGIVSSDWDTDDGHFTFYFDILNQQERVGGKYMTPHMSNFDFATKDWTGRVTQLSPGLNGEGLIAWSRGGVNNSDGGSFPAAPMPQIDAGIYLVPNANDVILDPINQYVAVIDNPEYNEMWPKSLTPLAEQFGHEIAIPPALDDDNGEPFGFLQAASIRTRLTESSCLNMANGSDAMSDRSTSCYWHMQGTQTGTVLDSDMVGMRILAVVPEALSKGWSPDFPRASYQFFNKGWFSPNKDRIYILGEFSTIKRDDNGDLILNANDTGTSGQVQADTSYVVRVPAWVPLFQQSLDKNGLATATELTWHHVAPKERKTCTGCHMRTQELPAFLQSAAGADPERYAVDVAMATPLFTGTRDVNGDPIVATDTNTRMKGIEWSRDVAPILQTNCASCHSGSRIEGGLRLDNSLASYTQLAVPNASDGYKLPQVSKWTRMMSARESKLAWYAFGERLDGRPNVADPTTGWPVFSRSLDHPTLSASDRLTLARWIDIGMPMDLKPYYQSGSITPNDASSVAWKTRRSYTGDDLPPILTMTGIPQPNPVCSIGTIKVGFWDNEEINPASFSVRVDSGENLATPPESNATFQTVSLNLVSGNHSIHVELEDINGNRAEETWDVKIDPSDGCSSTVLSAITDGGNGGDNGGGDTPPPPPPPPASDLDHDGVTADSGDCNDENADIYPGKIEQCNGVDDNCSGVIDEDIQTVYFRDSDHDGHGLTNSSLSACTAPSGYVRAAGDCNDQNSAVYPGATELCDQVDNNCNSQVDENLSAITSYLDSDRDGYGTSAGASTSCSIPSGYVRVNGDCNDSSASINPGATEVCDQVDNNCNSQVDENLSAITSYLDADRDGYGTSARSTTSCSVPSGYVRDATDCNDTLADTHPLASEANDCRDNDCDGYAETRADMNRNKSLSKQVCSGADTDDDSDGFVYGISNGPDVDDTNAEIWGTQNIGVAFKSATISGTTTQYYRWSVTAQSNTKSFVFSPSFTLKTPTGSTAYSKTLSSVTVQPGASYTSAWIALPKKTTKGTYTLTGKFYGKASTYTGTSKLLKTTTSTYVKK